MPRKKTQITKILDGELHLQAPDNVLEQRRTGPHEHDVIDIQEKIHNVRAAA